jgi:outer membrane protein TolC
MNRTYTLPGHGLCRTAMCNFFVVVAVLLAGPPAIAGPSSGTPFTLDDCYKAALVRSEVVAQQKELAIQAGEKMSQAIGGLLPSVSGSAGYQREEKTGI